MATCVVSGKFADSQGNPVVGATVHFAVTNPVLDAYGNALTPKEVTTSTAGDGSWSLSLVQGSSGELTLDLIPTSLSSVVKYPFSLSMPLTSTASFSQCWVDGVSFAGPFSSASLTFPAISGTLEVTQLPALPNTQIWVGNGSSQATPVSISGDISLTSAGAASLVATTNSTLTTLSALSLPYSQVTGVVSNPYFINEFTLSPTDIANGYVTLSPAPANPTQVVLTPIGGPMQSYGTDYTVSGSQLIFGTALAPGGSSALVSGDQLVVQYT